MASKETNFEINLKYETYSIQNSKELRSSQETIVTQYKLNPEYEFKIDSTNLKKINPVNENEKLVIRVKTTEKNNQIFYIIHTDRSWIAQVEGKKYYLLNLDEEERAAEAVARLLYFAAPEQPEKEPEANETPTEETPPTETPEEETPEVPA